MIKSSTAQINFLKILNKQTSKNYFRIFKKKLENNENIRKIQKKDGNFVESLCFGKVMAYFQKNI